MIITYRVRLAQLLVRPSMEGPLMGEHSGGHWPPTVVSLDMNSV